eukprot:jgi/Botrbrau1/10450/Bobra.0133s0057.1
MKKHKEILGILLFYLVTSCVTGQLGDPQAGPSILPVLNQFQSPNTSEGTRNFDTMVANATWFWAAQITPAQLSDTLPTLPTLSPDGTFYKLKVCDRVSITDCLPYGPPSPGVPENLQGIWWSDGLQDPAIVVSNGVGPFNARSRVLTVSTYANQQFGFDGTSSEWQGGYWTVSGAGFVNALLVLHLEYPMYLNEDFTHAQIVPVIKIMGVPIAVPTSIIDFTMDWEGQDSWVRSTRVLSFWRNSVGHYPWKRIINVDGSKGLWYDKGWLTSKDGIPVAVPVQVVPPL